MPDSETNPVPHRQEPHLRRDEIASRARAEALAMACADTAHSHRPAGELVAAALKAHRTLSRGLGPGGPVTPLGPDAGVRGLAAFLAVYAAQQEHRDDRDPAAAA
ncbi:hypothetical protein [Streptomyces sp. ALI-76-A]|jgi:hypothetical protein|uniref:hypothetical protein n=1 Tax=Streptomyces sp. ALI-76-A TaxID=3025736 RepID=UPI00256EF139|nr:hypothetical protein [Streptomyces sp. ALI-76-A]MDL5205439.1 hypothetical protein [Streptomyces sp. ALI-76-A]